MEAKYEEFLQFLATPTKTRLANGQDGSVLPTTTCTSGTALSETSLNSSLDTFSADDESYSGRQTSIQRHQSGELRSALKGIGRQSSIMHLQHARPMPQVEESGDESYVGEPTLIHRRSGELRSALKGIGRQSSIILLQPEGPPTQVVYNNNTESSNDLVHSNREYVDHKQKDILSEGQAYLAVSMLVYMYSHLRESARQGLTRVRLEDIDVQSCQSQYNSQDKDTKYLEKTKTVGSIIRFFIDELDNENEKNYKDHELLSGQGKEYEKSQTAQFQKWIEDSKVSQLDKETEVMIATLRRKVARHRWKRAINAVRISYKLSGGKAPRFDTPVCVPGYENENRFVNLNQMMNEVIRERPKYFKQGSIMDNLIETGLEMVWFSDLTQNDVVYGICCQRDEKQVIVVFRGTVNSHNWKMNFKFDTDQYRNPIRTDYRGRKDELSLHSGFALYLMRKRKDTGLTKMQEIFDKIDVIGRELCPEGNYKLSITGHSMGGALATLFGFYVAAKSKFDHLKRVNIWTYAAPRVGCSAFLHAYQHLERIGRIRHARFSNSHDIVPLIPSCNFKRDDLQFYEHVGMRVQLHGAKVRLNRALDVTYPLRHDWLSRLKRIFMNSHFANLTTMKQFDKNHTLGEYQRRLLFASQYKHALAQGRFFGDEKRNKIKSLDEYYAIRAHIHDSSNMGGNKQCQDNLKDTPDTKLLRQVLAFVLMIVWLIFISTMF